MTAQELAAQLDARQIGQEITPDEAKDAAKNGLIVIYGASDDLCEIEGSIRDEVGCYDGGWLYLKKTHIYSRDCEDENCPHETKALDQYAHIEIKWNGSGEDFCWKYKTDLPHATFDIYDDAEKYCRGIVIHKDYLP